MSCWMQVHIINDTRVVLGDIIYLKKFEASRHHQQSSGDDFFKQWYCINSTDGVGHRCLWFRLSVLCHF